MNDQSHDPELGPDEDFAALFAASVQTKKLSTGQHLTGVIVAIGAEAALVDVGAKAETHRVARASGLISMRPATFRLIAEGTAKKGDVLVIARIAAIQAAKRTSDWIPLCHPLALTRITVAFMPQKSRSRIRIEVTAETIGKTGVEMEALCGASAGLLTIYDMCKAVDRGMVISEVMLMEKRGGKSGVYLRP